MVELSIRQWLKQLPKRFLVECRQRTGAIRYRRAHLHLECLERRDLFTVSLLGDPIWTPRGPGPLDFNDSRLDPNNNNFARDPVAGDLVIGAMSAIAVDPNDSTGNTLLASATGGGIWRSTDNGQHWAPETDQFGSVFITNIAYSPLNSRVVFASIGNLSSSYPDNFTLFSTQVNGVLRSTDDGVTWAQLDPTDFGGKRLTRIVPTTDTDPTTSKQILLAAAMDGGGIYRSIDGGKHWTSVIAGDSAGNTLNSFNFANFGADLVRDATHNGRYFAAIPGPNGGVYRSDDDGWHWMSLAPTGSSIATDLVGGNTALTTLSADVTANPSDFQNDPVNVASVSGIAVNHVIQIDNEQMLVKSIDAAKKTLTVGRAANGTGLAAHKANTNLFAGPSARVLLALHSTNTDFALYSEVLSGGHLTNLYRSTDAGTASAPNWAAVANASDPFRGGQGYLHGAILADPNNDHVVYVSGDAIQIYPFTGILYQVDAAAGKWQPLCLIKDNTTTLTANVNATSTTLNVANASAISTNAIIQVDSELMLVTARDTTNNTLTVTRGVNGTSSASHPAAYTNGPNAVILITNGANNTGPHADSRVMVWHNGNILQGNDGGLYELTKLSTSPTWVSAMGNLQTTQFVSAALDSVHNSIIGGAQDNSTEFLVNGTGSNLTWRAAQVSGDGQLVAVDQSADPWHYVSTQSLGGFQRFQLSTDKSGNNTIVNGHSLALNVDGTGKTLDVFDSLPFTTTWALSNAASAQNNLVIGTTHLYESTNQGDNLTELGGPITSGAGTASFTKGSTTVVGVGTSFTTFFSVGDFIRLDGDGTFYQIATIASNVSLTLTRSWLGASGTGAYSKGPVTFLGTVSAIAYGGVSGGKDNRGVLYVGDTRGSLMLRTGAVGTGTFTNIAPTGLQSVQAIALDPTDWHVAVVVTQTQIFLTTDAGSHWSEIEGNLTDPDLLSATIANLGETRVILVGGSQGLYRTLAANGTNTLWTQYGQNLPNVPVADVHYYGGTTDTLLVATFGRGVWTVANASNTLPTSGELDINENTAALHLNPNNALLLDVFLNKGTSTSGTPDATYKLSSLSKIVVMGTGVNDALVIDSTMGIDTTVSGIRVALDSISFTGTGNNSQLVFQGQTFDATQTESLSATPFANGMIKMNNTTIAYNNTQAIDDLNNAVSFVYNATDTGEAINVIDGISISPAQVTQVNSGASHTFIAVNFANKTSAIVNALGGDDTITINNTNPAAGLTALTVDCGTGDDTATVLAVPVAAPLTVDGGSGTDTVTCTFAQDFQGDLTLINFEKATVSVGRDFTGSLKARSPGDLQSVTIGRSLTSTGILQADGTLGQLLVGGVVSNQAVPGNVAGQIHVGNFGLGYVYGSVPGTIKVDKDLSVMLDVFGDLTGTVQVGGNVAELFVLGSQSGLLDVGHDITELEIGTALTRSGMIQVSGNLWSLLVSKGLAGQVLVVGNLDQARIYEGMSGILAVQGNVGRALTAQGDQLDRNGNVLVTGDFSGQMVVMGNLLADLWLKSDLTGRIAVLGSAIPGLSDSARKGILGSIQIDGSIGPTGAIVSGGLLGDQAASTQLTAGGIRGILAAKGAISLGGVGDPDLSQAKIFDQAAGVDATAIDALFTDNGKPLFIDASPQGRANLALILAHLAALHVDSNGHLVIG